MRHMIEGRAIQLVSGAMVLAGVCLVGWGITHKPDIKVLVCEDIHGAQVPGKVVGGRVVAKGQDVVCLVAIGGEK